ncbi:MAG: molecular chaperone HtpG [Lachnospiraceae bacterium]|nr:molecular chaperone HtpG [Candidatus Merdinaster equi]
MASKHGSLSINSDNIFPIIKKWLYSDHDIFYRELISNGCDAITKLKKLDMMGEYELPEGFKGQISVICSPEKKTLTFIDNGLGMTADEVEEYINQIAFSGATDFIEKYKDKAGDDQIIGHFGLGFYSAFMVADEVHIDTLSYKEGAKPVHWECDGGTEFDMEEGDKAEVGTKITLFLNEDVLKFCNEYEAREVIKKYCSFMPYEIYLSKENTTDTQTIEESEKLDSDKVIEEIAPEKEGDAKKLKIAKRPELLNDTQPLWTKNPTECTKEDYVEFYRKVFHDYKEPLFWIHLNMDYPFNLKGILYFPKINMEYESIEGTIKLYNNQVFIADNIKEVIPEFLMLLKGVIDCPDLPLNVSRSALQNDGFVKKISDYIIKKVADKLSGMCKTEKEEYEKYWDDINPFIKYGCLKDDKFCEKMTDYILFKNLDGKYETLPECLEVKATDPDSDENAADAVDAESGEKVEAEEIKPGEDADADEKEEKNKVIYYVTDEVQQSQYINMFRKAKKDAIILKDNIDQPFISQLESKNEGIHFMRIDADINDELKGKTSKKQAEELEAKSKDLEKLFKKIIKKDNISVKLENLKNKDISSMITLSEETRRMQDMMKMYGMAGMGMPGGMGKEGMTLTLNANNKLVQYILDNQSGDNVSVICEQLYDMALLQQAPLDPEAMTKFVARTNKIMLLLAE